ncbi:MAG TPA: SufD family Fe-S cluster assembly protein [Solirubrobacteraceae bacterium]|nr:SufD family Fe-S cluster assembly protein [Solirubrobacteraceae bacterium]
MAPSSPERGASATREATLYRPLAGAGARADLAAHPACADATGAEEIAAQLRKAALSAYERLELPEWRRSGFWTTSFAALDISALEARHHEPGTSSTEELLAAPLAALPARERAGRIIQLDGSIVAVELAPSFAERGVILCPLAEAPAREPKAFSEHFSRRLTIDRHKLEAANAALWSDGVFLYVPPGCAAQEPFEIINVVSGAGVAQHARVLIVGERASDFRVHEHGIAPDGIGQALHTESFELYLHDGARCRLANIEDWGSGEVFNQTTRVVSVGRDAYCHWLPAQLGGHLMHEHLELALSEPGGDMAFRGLFFSEGAEQLDTFAVDLHETGPSGGDVHFRGAATGSSRASMEGLIKINPGAQQSHTYLQIHTMMLSDQARIDAIPSVLVSADDVSASHGGTVGELDESAIFYMASRGLDRAAAVRVLVEGFFEPIIAELADGPLEELVRAKIAAKLARARTEIEAYVRSR